MKRSRISKTRPRSLLGRLANPVLLGVVLGLGLVILAILALAIRFIILLAQEGVTWY